MPPLREYWLPGPAATPPVLSHSSPYCIKSTFVHPGFLGYWDRFFLCRPGWPEVYCVTHPGFQHIFLCFLGVEIAGLSTMPSLPPWHFVVVGGGGVLGLFFFFNITQ